MPVKSVLIMAGGTGGHVYPALAIAEYLREQGVQLFWLGTSAGLESRLVPDNDIPLFTVNVSGLRGKGLVSWITSPLTIIIALLQSLGVILRQQPSAVIGLGGFVSGPGGVAAWMLGKPLFIHEQNAVPGLTNRLLMPLARKVMQGFPGALKDSRAVTTGNPVRKDILSVATPAARMAGRENQPLRLLVLGGSLGAKALNEILPEVINNLPDTVNIEVWHQTGTQHITATTAFYQSYQIPTDRVVPYIDDMSAAYAWADVVLCRAGALTISELCVVGVAAVLVPYPYAVDDHQSANARYLSESGAAILVSQQDLSVARIVELLCGFDKNRSSLTAMATAARSRAYPDATTHIGNICMEAINV